MKTYFGGTLNRLVIIWAQFANVLDFPIILYAKILSLLKLHIHLVEQTTWHCSRFVFLGRWQPFPWFLALVGVGVLIGCQTYQNTKQIKWKWMK